jgi:hypothetical protein
VLAIIVYNEILFHIINTIEELDLIKEEGEIVMGDDSIEIYDNYRE